MPPSSPTIRYFLPRYVTTADECWSGCVVGKQSPVCCGGSMDQHGNGKFQYGPGVSQLAPPFLVSKTSSRPAYRWSGLVGSTWRNWLYQAWMPGWYPAPVSAEPEL